MKTVFEIQNAIREFFASKVYGKEEFSSIDYSYSDAEVIERTDDKLVYSVVEDGNICHDMYDHQGIEPGKIIEGYTVVPEFIEESDEVITGDGVSTLPGSKIKWTVTKC